MPSPLPSVDSKASRLIFSQETLAAVGDSDGADYQDAEFNSNWALATIRADVAYQHGYFGQNTTIAVMDDGMDLNHPDLAGKTVQPRNILNGDSNVSEGSRGAIHGTYVAMLAAGARGNSQGSFVINSNDGLQVPTKNTQGVAPAASVIPIQLRGGANPLEGIEYAVSKKAHVLNASISPAGFYYGKYGNRDGIWLTLAPHFHPLLLDSQLRRLSGHEDFVEEMGVAARAMGDDADMILVWAASNEGWNSGNLHTGICGKNFREEDGCNLNLDDLPVTKQELMENFVYYPDPDDASITISFKDMWGTGCGEENCIEYDVPNPWGLAPLLYPNLLGRLLVVGAVGQDGHYSAFSNGCGVARNWCLTAPGANFRIFENEGSCYPGEPPLQPP